MSPLAVALRLLLCLALVLNGAGNAAAALRMVIGHGATTVTGHAGGHDPVAAMQSGQAQTHCHENPGAAHEGSGKSSPHGQPGCCDSGDCTCSCMQQAPASFAVPVLVALASEPAAFADRSSAAHLPPTLPHLIRPPIRQST
jgi:hypothetical protein